MGIRAYREPDVDRVIEVWRAASAIATPFLTGAFLEREAREIRDVWLRVANTWVYEVDEVVAGFIALIENEVGGIFVHPAAQGAGIGRALMDHAVRVRGALELDVFEANRVGRRFYRKYGFTEVSRSICEATGEPQIRLAYRPGTAAHRG